MGRQRRAAAEPRVHALQPCGLLAEEAPTTTPPAERRWLWSRTVVGRRSAADAKRRSGCLQLAAHHARGDPHDTEAAARGDGSAVAGRLGGKWQGGEGASKERGGRRAKDGVIRRSGCCKKGGSGEVPGNRTTQYWVSANLASAAQSDGDARVVEEKSRSILSVGFPPKRAAETCHRHNRQLYR